MATHVEFEQWVPFPIAAVFTFFSNPENLPRIMPDASATKLVALKRVAPVADSDGPVNEKAAGIGSVLITSFRIVPFLPFRKEWIARITEFEWNHHFADVQDQGPFRSWHHRHEFVGDSKDSQSGTTIRDVIDYEIGFGFLGQVAEALVVRRQLKHAFQERQKRLPQLLHS